MMVKKYTPLIPLSGINIVSTPSSGSILSVSNLGSAYTFSKWTRNGYELSELTEPSSTLIKDLFNSYPIGSISAGPLTDSISKQPANIELVGGSNTIIQGIRGNVLKISNTAGNYLRLPKANGDDISVGAITMRVRNWTSNFLLDGRRITQTPHSYIYSGGNGTIGTSWKVYNQDMVEYSTPNVSFYNNSNWSFLYIVPQARDELYAFSSHTFTNCNKTGKDGPTLSECKTVYTDTWTDEGYLNMTTQGFQEWTVPLTATYRISAYGAEGGDNTSTNEDAVVTPLGTMSNTSTSSFTISGSGTQASPWTGESTNHNNSKHNIFNLTITWIEI